MTSRRQVLQIGLTGAALLPVARYASAWLSTAEAEPFYAVIFDERFPKSRLLASEIAGPSATLAAIRGDVTALWYHDLYFAWQRHAAPVAGVTSAGSLFCLELLARDAGMRVTHRQVVDGDLVSWAIGPRRARR
jgi:hypothetical protein